MLVLIRHRVRDFDSWKPMFDAHQPAREHHEITRHRVYRSLNDPNEVLVAVEFPSTERARAFMEDPSLRETMDEAGVLEPVEVTFFDEVEELEYTGVGM